MSAQLRLRRSFCYVPPAYPAALEASRQLNADVLCLDLEDSTPPAVKIDARRILTEYLAAGKPKAREVLVRVNALDTEWGFEDLRFAATLGVDGVLLPKVEGDGTVRQALKILADTVDAPPALWCLVETPLGILRVEQIAACPVEGLVVGGADLAEGLGARHTPSRTPLLYALSQIVLAARAYGRTAIDAMHPDFGDLAGLEAAAQQGVELGFHGKSVFTAEDVAIVNRIFAPSEQDVAKARVALSGAGGYGAHLAHARWVIALHELASDEP
jgi:citrate lyase subunit beta/citryl-CoA lyase